MEEKLDIKAIIGLGNPEEKRKSNRHNIGFRVVDQLAQLYNGSWKPKDKMEITQESSHGKSSVTINADQPGVEVRFNKKSGENNSNK